MSELLIMPEEGDVMHNVATSLLEDVVVPDTVAELLAEEPAALTPLSVGMSTGASEDYD